MAENEIVEAVAVAVADEVWRSRQLPTLEILSSFQFYFKKIEMFEICFHRTALILKKKYFNGFKCREMVTQRNWVMITWP